MGTVPETLHAFGQGTLVVRAVGALLGALGDPEPPPYPNVDAAVDAVAPGSDGAARAAAARAAVDMVSSSILALGAAVDGADRQLARQGTAGIEVQAEDAVIKALTLAAIARRLGGDTPEIRVQRLTELPSGRAVVATWAAVDVALPLGGVDLKKLLATHQATQSSRFAAIAGEEALEGVATVLPALVPVLQQAIDRAAPKAEALALALAPYVPGLVATAQGAGEALGLQGDRLPIYKWIAARIAVEHAVRRAAGA